MSRAYKTYTDAELVLLFLNKKKESVAFSEIYERYKSMVIAYARSLLDDMDTAQEIFQETFIKLYMHLKEKQNVANLPGLLITICRNLCYNTHRNKKNNLDIELVNLVAEEYYDFEKKDLLEIIVLSVEFLDEKYRRSFMLREFDGRTYKEIAEIEGINAGNAKIRVLRAKKQLIEILQPYIKDLNRN